MDTLPIVMQCFKKTNTVVGEVLIADEKDMVDQTMPYMKLKETTLDQVLSEQEFKQVDIVFSSITQQPGSLSFMNDFNPAAVRIIIAVLMSPNNASPANPGLDSYFQKLGRESNKAVIGLETIEEQSGFLFKDPIEKQKQLLMKFVSEIEKNKRIGESLVSSYKNQELESLMKLFKESSTPEEMEDLIFKRNRNWATSFLL